MCEIDIDRDANLEREKYRQLGHDTQHSILCGFRTIVSLFPPPRTPLSSAD